MDFDVVDGSLAIDDRGTLSFVNGFDMRNVRRFYTVSNHHRGQIRAWHLHEFEHKYVTVLRGAAVIGLVKVDDPRNPNRDASVTCQVLSASAPKIVHIPCGYANGSMTLTEDALLAYFSTSTLEQSKSDDYRYRYDFWDVWQENPR